MRLPNRLNQWPEDAREEWDERVSIIHFDGEINLKEAKAMATKLVRRRWLSK